RWVSVPAGFCDRTLGAAAPMMHGCSAITEAQTQAFLEAMQGDRTAAVLMAPQLVVPNGREATVRADDTRYFVTGLTTKLVNGAAVLVPQSEPVQVGPTLTVRPTLSGRFVNLELQACRYTVSKVE